MGGPGRRFGGSFSPIFGPLVAVDKDWGLIESASIRRCDVLAVEKVVIVYVAKSRKYDENGISEVLVADS